jgi:hypothetical protein
MVIVGIVGVLLVGVAIVWANTRKLQKSVENQFYPAEISNAVQEKTGSEDNDFDENTDPTPKDKDLTWEENGDSYTAVKEVQILNADKKNENNADAYIRVCLVPRWTGAIISETEDNENDVLVSSELNISFDTLLEEADGTGFPTKITGTSYIQGDVTFYLAPDWSDGWLYNPADGFFYCRKKVAPGETTPVLLKSVSVAKETLDKKYQGLKLQIDILSDSIQTEGGAIEARWTNVEVDTNGSLSVKQQSVEQQ